MKEVILWGATGQSRVLHEALEGLDARVVALVDNREIPSPWPGVPALRGEDGLAAWLAHRGTNDALYCAVAVGGDRGADRLLLLELMQRYGLIPLTIVHRTAFVAGTASLDEGCQVLAQAAICACARLGRAVIINTAASVDHDCVVGDGVHVAPGAHIAGEVTLGARCFIGTGAAILPRIRIGDDAIVGAGAVVVRDVAAGVTVVGNPAKILKAKETTSHD